MPNYSTFLLKSDKNDGHDTCKLTCLYARNSTNKYRMEKGLRKCYNGNQSFVQSSFYLSIINI